MFFYQTKTDTSAKANNSGSTQLYLPDSKVNPHKNVYKILIFPVCAEKPEESQAPKPAKKKKARRETWDGRLHASVWKRLHVLFMQHLKWQGL